MRRTLLAAAVLCAACSKPAPAPAPVPLLLAAERAASASEACGKVIPAEWSPSTLVPARDGGKLVFKMFFFGRDGVPATGFFFHRAEGDATLAPDGRVLSCARRPGEAGRLPKFVPKPGVTLEDLERREAALYPALASVAALYAAGKPLAPDQKKAVSAFAADFAFFVEPGQGPDYRALSPDFWTWVESNGGAAPR